MCHFHGFHAPTIGKTNDGFADEQMWVDIKRNPKKTDVAGSSGRLGIVPCLHIVCLGYYSLQSHCTHFVSIWLGHIFSTANSFDNHNQVSRYVFTKTDIHSYKSNASCVHLRQGYAS